MSRLYLVLALIGTIAPYAAFAPWLAAHGPDVDLLLTEMFATDVARFFSLDVIVSAVVVFVMVSRSIKRGVPHAWLAIVGTLCVGVSLGLPLCLYLEARHDERAAT